MRKRFTSSQFSFEIGSTTVLVQLRPELVDLAADGQIVFAGKFRKISSTVHIFEVVAIGNEVNTRADLPHPERGLRIDQDYGFIIAYI
jgi:hypothetical protein